MYNLFKQKGNPPNLDGMQYTVLQFFQSLAIQMTTTRSSHSFYKLHRILPLDSTSLYTMHARVLICNQHKMQAYAKSCMIPERPELASERNI